MNLPSTVLRPAKPTFEEGLVFARYFDEVTEGFFRFMLGRRVVEIVATAYTQPGHDLSYENITFAERDDVIIGVASAYTAEQHRRASDEPLKRAAGSSAFRMSVVGTLFAPLIRILDTIADGDFYLQAIAIDKQHRGQGLGSALIDAIEDQAIAAGSTRLSLDVSAGNKTALRLYEHRGMTVESEWPKRLKIPGLRFLRMTKAL
jgi:ribosomal protein S18 acetylase RimI-like enzyme